MGLLGTSTIVAVLRNMQQSTKTVVHKPSLAASERLSGNTSSHITVLFREREFRPLLIKHLVLCLGTKSRATCVPPLLLFLTASLISAGLLVNIPDISSRQTAIAFLP